MKIACISASQVPSTTANSIQVMKACRALAQEGHEVRLYVPGQEAHPWQKLAQVYGLGPQPDFQVEWLPARSSLHRYDFSWSAVRAARAVKAGVVYAWPPQAAWFALLQDFPTLLELHGPPEGRFGPLVFRLILRQAGKKRLLPITHALARLLERDYQAKFAPAELVVSPNGVDLERYCELPDPVVARRKLGLPEALTAGYTGHLYEGRGMGLLVELARAFPAVQFLWVGGRPADVETWKRRLEGEGIGNVHLAGFIENSRMALYQAAADILLMPYERRIAGSGGGNSADYCSPMKMFEYMACRRAIISSDLPVIHEVLNETNSVLCPPEDAPAWVRDFGSLLSDADRQKTLAENAWKDVQQYTWQRRAQKALEGFDA